MRGRAGGEGTVVEVVFVEEAAGYVAYAAGYMDIWPWELSLK
jgi:hypothetical protein